MGDKKDRTKKTTGSMPRESSQVGTHGQTGGQGQYQGQDRSEGEGMGGNQGNWKQGDPTMSSDGAWNDRAQREMQQGDRTDPAQPDGTSPLDKDQQPVNQNRPGQGHQSPR